MSTQTIRPSKRANKAIAAVMAATIGIGSSAYVVIFGGQKVPPVVALAVEITPDWEGLKTEAYWDALGKTWSVCIGEAKGIKKGDHFTVQQCKDMFVQRFWHDFWEPVTRCAPRILDANVGIQWAMTDGAYNFGVGRAASTGRPGSGWCGSSAADAIRRGDFAAACIAQTAWNKAAGRVIPQLVARREMGNAKTIGEAEACITGVAIGNGPAPLAVKIGGGAGL